MMPPFHDVMTGLRGFVALGGPVVALLLAMSVLAGAVVLFKLWQLRGLGLRSSDRLRAALRCWDEGDQAGAQRLAEAAGGPLAPFVAQAMRSLQGQPLAARVGLRDRLRSEADGRLAGLEGGFRLLDAVAQVAPLLGLFGTVLGMIEAFRTMQGAGATVDPSVLAGGIWVALLTTAVGLAVAMPASVLLTWFEARVAAAALVAQAAVETLAGHALSAPDRTIREVAGLRGPRHA